MAEHEKAARRGDDALRARPLPRALHEGFHAFVAARPEATYLDDLLVAFGAAEGERSCLDVLERDFFAQLPRILGRHRLSEDDLADLSQRLRMDLVVGSGDRPKKLLAYGGTGPLGGWLRAVATRTALSDLRKTVPPTEPFDGEIMGFATDADDTMQRLARAHAGALGDALRAAMSALPARDRNLLRMYVLDGANIDTIGRVYGVHRATVARWIGEIRVRLARDARDRMMPRVSGSEVQSLARLCFSQLDLSLDRLLAADRVSTAI